LEACNAPFFHTLNRVENSHRRKTFSVVAYPVGRAPRDKVLSLQALCLLAHTGAFPKSQTQATGRVRVKIGSGRRCPVESGACGEEHGSDTREYPVPAELSSRTWTYRQSSDGDELKLSTTTDASGVYHSLLIASKGAWARIEINEQSVCALAKAIASIEKNRADAFVIQSS
jgi:hypothetical protein